MSPLRFASRLSLLTATVAMAAVVAFAGRSDAQMQSTDGGTLYRSYCGSCHGVGAKGDGPLAQHLRFRPPDLTRIAAQKGGDFPADEVRQTIDGRNPLPGHGGGDMPVWGEAFKQSGGVAGEAGVESRINALVEYIGSLQEK